MMEGTNRNERSQDTGENRLVVAQSRVVEKLTTPRDQLQERFKERGKKGSVLLERVIQKATRL
jgi:hypothetical protein